MKPKPVSETVMSWLRANLGPRCLAPLTGTDAKALRASVHIIDLYNYTPSESLIDAWGKVVRCMHKLECQELAYHAVAHVMDWDNRAEIWGKAGLPEFSPRRCVYEPQQMGGAR